MHVKHVEIKSPHVGVMWKFGRGVISSGPPALLTGEGIKLPCIFEAVREIYRNIFGLASFEKVDRFRSEIQLAGHPVRGLNDEAHFWLNGYVNKQNCCIWSEANPQVHVETPLHPEKLTVWCALWAGGILLQKR
ncbi:hypothetical protein TNCV_3497411 [Trichonephila clavipes]|nr:hypothetical protein TNCV_3497411 [Trichonephila clavipes]